MLLITAIGSDDSIVFVIVAKFFFSVFLQLMSAKTTNAFAWWRWRRLCSCNLKLACIHEMLHKHGPRAVLSLEQGLTILF